MLRPLLKRRLVFTAIAIIVVAICYQVARAQVDDPTDGETDPIKLFERGQSAHSKGDLSRALTFYEGALKLRPEFPEAEYQRATALVALNRPPDAEQAFARAIELRKDWVLPYIGLGNLLTRLSRDQEAEPLLRRALQLGASDSVTLDSLSTIRSRAGDKQEALALAKRATEDDNASAFAWAWRGAMERLAGNPSAAMTSLNHSLELESNYFVALKERAEIHLEAREFDPAISDLKAALLAKENDKDISLRLAYAYELAGKIDEARSLYEKFGQTLTQVKGSHNVVGTEEDIAAANNDDPKVAMPALDRLIAANPKNAFLLARLGEITRRTDPQKSAECYRRANEIDPANPKYAIGYAAALVQSRQFTQAVALLRRVIASAPNEYTAHANLALALYELKDYAAAVPEYEWLIATRPEATASYFFLAIAHDNLGEYEQALDAYDRFLARADPGANKLEIDKINLRLPVLRDQIKRGQGKKQKKP